VNIVLWRRLPSLFLRLTTSFSGMAMAWPGRKRQQHHAAATRHTHTHRHVLTRRPFSSSSFFPPLVAISTLNSAEFLRAKQAAIPLITTLID